MLRIAIADDEYVFRRKIDEFLKWYLSQKGVECKAEFYDSGKEIIEMGRDIRCFDIFFLDISMKNINGIKTAEIIRKHSEDAFIVFVTAYIDYSIEGYKVNAIRYVLKDVENMNVALTECMDAVMKKMASRKPPFKYKFNEGIKEVSANKILYVESRLHKLIFHIFDEKQELLSAYQTLNAMERELSTYSTFVRVHQSFLVNLRHIETVNHYTVFLLNGEKISVPKSRYNDVKKLLQCTRERRDRMIYILMDFVIIVIEAVCCQMFFGIFINEETKDRRGLIKKVLTVFLMSLLCYAAARIIEGRILAKQLVVFIVIVGIMTFIREVPYKKAMVLSLFFQGMLAVMEYLALVFSEIVIPDIENMDAAQETIGRIIVVISLFFCFVAVLLVRRIFRGYKYKTMYDEEWMKYILFPVITIVMLSAILKSFRNESDIAQLQVLCGIGLGLVVMNYLVFYLLEDVIKRKEEARAKESLEIQGAGQLEMYSKMRESFEIQKSEAHEFKNHLMCIQTLAEEYKYEELLNYIRKINGIEISGSMVVNTNNDIVNAVINTKYMEASKKHIVFSVRVNDLSQISMDEKDLVVLLSNLLNNAIEATEKCETDKIINIKFFKEHGNIILSVKNHYADPLIEVEGGFLTTKKHGKNMHGVGIKNVLKVIDKYQGTYNICTDNDEFFFSVLIPESVS